MPDKKAIDLTFKNKDFERYYYQVILNRAKLMQMCETSKLNRAVIMQKCRDDLAFWANHFVYTFNPRSKPSTIPFILFPRQIDMLHFIDQAVVDKQWATILKCRYTGASYVSTLYILHALLFKSDMALALASNKKESVYKRGDPNCLFEKVITMYHLLPDWMKTFDLEANRTDGLIKNPKQNVSLRGYSGRDIGRGGRSTVCFVDETAFVDQDEAAVSALSENTDCAVFISTPSGTNNKFYELCHNEKIMHFIFRWEADPRRDAQWAEEQRLKLGDAIFEQELNCSFNAGVEGQLIDIRWAEACLEADIDWVDPDNKFLASPNTRTIGLDIGINRDKTVAAIRDGNKIVDIKEFPANDLPNTLQLVHDYAVDNQVVRIVFDATGVGSSAGAMMERMYPRAPFEMVAYYSGGSAGDDYIEDFHRKGKEYYVNRRARDWCEMATRLRLTYLYLNGKVPENQFRSDDGIILIDKDHKHARDVIVDFCKPVLEQRNGKKKIESKQDMRDRGVSSTDFSDAIIMAWYEAYGGFNW